MKFSAILAAAMASVAMAAPAKQSFAGLEDITKVLNLQGLEGLTDNLQLGNIADELQLSKLPLLSKIGDLQSEQPAQNGVQSNGKLVQNLGPHLNNILTVVGPDVGTLLIELSPEVTALVSGLGLPALGAPLGSVVASASGLGGLVTGLGPKVDGLVTVVGADGGALLVSLSGPVAGLVSGLGLPNVGVPVGTVVATLGKNLKRDELLKDVAPEVQGTLVTTGDNLKHLLLELSPEVTSLVAGLGLGGAAAPLGKVIADAADVGDLVKDVSEPVKQLLIVTNNDGKNLLIKLSPDVAAAVAGLGLVPISTPLGSILSTVGKNL
ncbi:hypothetical protein N7492_001177 [Penicillium capsulatum]|uniref:Uncharacterized protein n=1 Tax=Penicillium capsulatum TaxID=69766 RepID=A0A9W9IU68_9EURO|nr:hypothetical protein N7492_001177 [Penicillium capsulatum]KAJ6129767.1 hypothetical protein N7512_002547 [Penicillium capsulatum]